jgi:protein-S-isoprenylcysteine O-methyltransferase Ste14
MENADIPSRDERGRGALRKTGEILLKAVALFVILEPVWMLLPFAGFLYGSGLKIQVLARHPETAWLTHFVFPVLTLGWTGPVLVVAGFVVFLVAAGQVYWAKLRRKGLVTSGLYRWVRHPQYTALVLFGAGILLTWGRAVTFLAFFLMMFLYYYLAKSEERGCLGLFGEKYEEYRRNTSFCVPGDRILATWSAGLFAFRTGETGARAPSSPGLRTLRVGASFVVAMLITLGLMRLISTIRIHVRTVPFLSTTVRLEPPESGQWPEMIQGRRGGVPFVANGKVLVVRGPWRNAFAPGFAENVLHRLLDSPAMADFLAFLDKPGQDAAVVFCAPFTPPDDDVPVGERFKPRDSTRRGPEPDPDGPDRARLLVMRCELLDGAEVVDAVADRSKRRVVDMVIAKIDLSLPQKQDFVVEGPLTTGPFCPGEERWNHLMGQLAARESLHPRPDTEPSRKAPEPAAFAEVVMVKAPMLKTRLDPEFASDILRRLAGSARFRDRLRKFGAGENRVAVAFPRPGPNWYRTYHFHYEDHGGRYHFHGEPPQVSVFVMLVERGPGTGDGIPFDPSKRSERRILGAFIAELDFGIEPWDDPVYEIVIIGPRRDLEERWEFFLSGL